MSYSLSLSVNLCLSVFLSFYLLYFFSFFSPSKASNQRFLTTSGSPSPSSVEPGSSKPIKLSPKKTSTPKDAGSGSARRQALEKNVKQLRKKVKGIWWDGVKDKLVAFGVGFGAGLLIGIL